MDFYASRLRTAVTGMVRRTTGAALQGAGDGVVRGTTAFFSVQKCGWVGDNRGRGRSERKRGERVRFEAGAVF